MAFVVDNNTGTITCYQGDSGELTINGLPTDKNYKLYFAVQDTNYKPFGSEIEVDTNQSPTVVISIPASLSDLWVIPRGESYATYYYGVKICDSETGKEDTLMIGGSDFGDYSELIVYPKKVEGIE